MAYYDLIQNAALAEKCRALGLTPLTEKNAKIMIGGALEANRKAVRTRGEKPVILLDPVTPEKREFDTAVAQIAKDNGVRIAISMQGILNTYGIKKMRLLQNQMFLISICKKMRNDVILCTYANDEYGLRQPQMLRAYGQLIGLSRMQAEWAITKTAELLVSEK